MDLPAELVTILCGCWVVTPCGRRSPVTVTLGPGFFGPGCPVVGLSRSFYSLVLGSVSHRIRSQRRCKKGRKDGKGCQQGFADQSGILSGPQVTVWNLGVARENCHSLKKSRVSEVSWKSQAPPQGTPSGSCGISGEKPLWLLLRLSGFLFISCWDVVQISTHFSAVVPVDCILPPILLENQQLHDSQCVFSFPIPQVLETRWICACLSKADTSK